MSESELSTSKRGVLFPESLKEGYAGQYRDEYPEKLLRTIEEGYSIREFALSIGKTLQTVEKWGNKFPEFGYALSLACEYELSRYERYAEESASGASKGNAAMIKFLLSNKDRERYTEKKEVEHKGSISIIDTGIRRPGDPGFEEYCKKYNIDPSDFTDDKTISLSSSEYSVKDDGKERLDAPIDEHQVSNDAKKASKLL